MEIIKGRLQIASESGLGKTSTVIKSIYYSEGVKGFFRGYWVSLGVYLPYSVTWWLTYENTKQILRHLRLRHRSETSLQAVDYAVASSVSTVVSSTATNMLQLIQTRQQLATASEIQQLRPTDQVSLWRLSINLVKEVGLFRALFKGLHVRLAIAVPGSALHMAIIECISPDEDYFDN